MAALPLADRLLMRCILRWGILEGICWPDVSTDYSYLGGNATNILLARLRRRPLMQGSTLAAPPPISGVGVMEVLGAAMHDRVPSEALALGKHTQACNLLAELFSRLASPEEQHQVYSAIVAFAHGVAGAVCRDPLTAATSSSPSPHHAPVSTHAPTLTPEPDAGLELVPAHRIAVAATAAAATLTATTSATAPVSGTGPAPAPATAAASVPTDTAGLHTTPEGQLLRLINFSDPDRVFCQRAVLLLLKRCLLISDATSSAFSTGELLQLWGRYTAIGERVCHSLLCCSRQLLTVACDC